MKRIVLALAAAAMMGVPGVLFAQATDTDTLPFTVSVAPVLSIYAPFSGGASIAHDTTAASTGPGNATFGLNVTFIDTNYSVLPAGSFVSTVTGTITAN